MYIHLFIYEEYKFYLLKYILELYRKFLILELWIIQS